MKKTVWIVILLLFITATAAFADSVQESLGAITTEEVMTATRQMIQAGVRKDDAIAMTELMARHRISVKTTLRVQEIVRTAHQNGLPVGPLVDKVSEGVAKKVNEEFLIRAMENVHGRYAFSYDQAKLISHEQTRLHAVADTLAEGVAAGLSEDGVKAIVGRLRTRARDKVQAHDMDNLAQKTCEAARDMARLGVKSDTVVDVIGQSLEKGYTVRDMEQLRLSFMNRTRISQPEDVAREYAARIRSGASAGSLDSAGSQGSSGQRSGSGAGAESGSGSGAGAGGSSGGRGGGSHGGSDADSSSGGKGSGAASGSGGGNGSDGGGKGSGNGSGGGRGK